MVTQPRLFALNAIMLISLLLQLAMGIWLYLINYGWLTAGPIITLRNLHLINGLAFVTLVIVHIYMNRRWVRLQLFGSQAKNKAGTKSKGG